MMNLRRLLVRDQVLALGLALLALVALVWIGLSQLAWANAEGRVLADLRQVERQLEQRLVGMERLAEAVGEQWLHGELDPVDGALCWRLLHPWVNREEHLTGVNLVRTDGQGFGLGQTGRAWGGRGVMAEGAAFRFGPILGDPGEVASAPPKVAPDFRQRPWFQAGARATQGFWTEPFTFAARREGQPGISYVLPVRDAKGILKGVISLDLLLEGLTQVVWESRVTPGSSLMVVDAGGRVIAPPAGGGMSQSEARRKVFLSSVSPTHFPLAHQLLLQTQAGNPNGTNIRGRRLHYHGRLQVFSRAQGPDWRLVLAIPDEDVLADPYRRVGVVALVSVLIFGLFTLLVLRQARRLGRPLAQLGEAAEAMVRGEAPVVPETRIREVKLLGGALMEAHQAGLERERLTQQLQQTQRLETVGTLAGGIAHDVNNQLMAVLGQLDLGSEQLGAGHPARRHLDRATEAARRCAETTRALLAFSRPSKPNLVPLDINTVIQETLTLMGKVVGVQIQLRGDLGLGLPAVLGDPVQLEQVLVNLVINARDAMPGGGTLEVGSALRGDRVEVTVRDEGSGMSPEVQARMFDPFYTTKAPGAGTGLGLPMVLGIVQAHGGEIEVDSRLGVGTCFRVLLPIGGPPGALPTGTEIRSHSPRLTGLRLLLVEDEPIIRNTLGEALRRWGADVAEAGNGDAAWERLRAEGFDVIISDHLMPGCTGLELLERLRGQGRTLPLILVSGYGLDGMEARLAADPNLRVLPKPFQLARLAEVIQELQSGPGAPLPSGTVNG